jgi:hypothetical protein
LAEVVLRISFTGCEYLSQIIRNAKFDHRRLKPTPGARRLASVIGLDALATATAIFPNIALEIAPQVLVKHVAATRAGDRRDLAGPPSRRFVLRAGCAQVEAHPALFVICFPHFASRQVIPPDFKMLQ